jgi:hypothetical protein
VIASEMSVSLPVAVIFAGSVGVSYVAGLYAGKQDERARQRQREKERDK